MNTDIEILGTMMQICNTPSEFESYSKFKYKDSTSHQVIKACSTLSDKNIPITIATLKDYFQEQNLLDEIGGEDYLLKLLLTPIEYSKEPEKREENLFKLMLNFIRHQNCREQIFLGCVFSNREALNNVRKLHFEEMNHLFILDAMIELYIQEKIITKSTVAAKLKSKKQLKLIGGEAYLEMLANPFEEFPRFQVDIVPKNKKINVKMFVLTKRQGVLSL